MKKIIALLIVLASLTALVSCAKNEVDTVGDRFNASKPTKTVVYTAQQFGDTRLEGEYILTTGYIKGAVASVYEATYDYMPSVEDGSGEVVKKPVETEHELLEYLEGYGVRENGGAWDKEGENFVSDVGPVSLNLSSKYIKTFTYENGKLRCVVAAKNTAEVLGQEADLPVDISIEVTDDGASITWVKISYTIPEDTEAEMPETLVTIEAFYTYDNEQIDIAVK